MEESRLSGMTPEVVELHYAKITGGSSGLHAWTRQRIDAAGTRYDDPLTYTGKVSGVSSQTETWMPARMPDGSTLGTYPVYGYVKSIGLTPSSGPNFEIIGASSSSSPGATFSGAFVYLSGSGTFTANDAIAYTLDFDTEVYDTDAYHSSGAKYRFTIPSNGKYALGMKATALYSDITQPYEIHARIFIAIVRGGSTILHQLGPTSYHPAKVAYDSAGNPANALPTVLSHAMEIELQATDTVDFSYQFHVFNVADIAKTMSVLGDTSVEDYHTYAWIERVGT